MVRNGCIFTSECRVLSPLPDEPERLRIHAVFYAAARINEIGGSWLHAAIRDKVLDCSRGEGEYTLVGKPFSPLFNITVPAGEAELVFMPLENAFNSIGSSTFMKPRGFVRLGPCDQASAPMVFEGLNQFDRHIKYMWKAPAKKRGGMVPLSLVMKSLSARAGILLSLSTTPDVHNEVLGNALFFVQGQGFAGGNTRVLAMHYRAGIIPAWGGGTGPRRVDGAGEPSPHFGGHQLFWNSFWRQLSWRAAQQFEEEHRCAALGSKRSDTKRSPRSSFLLLGGDAHYSRQYTVKALHRAGLLKDALWSLSMPGECSSKKEIEGPIGSNGEMAPAPRENKEGWDAFCRLFPKRLDLELCGESGVEDVPKDTTFAPPNLYESTCARQVPIPRTTGVPGHEPEERPPARG